VRILPCFSHRSEGNEFLMDEFVIFVESTLSYKDMKMAIFEQPPEKVKQDKIFENVGYF
jgi:hypothetical protein